MENFHKMFKALGTDSVTICKEDGSCLTFKFGDKSFVVPNSVCDNKPVDPIEHLTNAFEFQKLTPAKYIEFLKNSNLRESSLFPSFEDLAEARVMLVPTPTFVQYYIAEPYIETKGSQVKTYRYTEYKDIDLKDFKIIYNVSHDDLGYNVRGLLKWDSVKLQ